MSSELNLKVLWFSEILGLAIDQKFDQQFYPLTSYYIWPRTEAWEQLKLELDSRAWLPKEDKIKILNNAAEIMNCWGEDQSLEAFKSVSLRFSNVTFLTCEN